MSNETENTNLQRRAFMTGATQEQSQEAGSQLRGYEGKTDIAAGANAQFPA